MVPQSRGFLDSWSVRPFRRFWVICAFSSSGHPGGLPRMRRIAVIFAIAFCSIPGTANAFSTGSFSHATATSDWSRGSFAGTVNWTDCNAGCNSYLILVYAEPAVYTCHAEDWLEESDPNIRQVWNSGGQTTNKTISFEQTNVSLIPGVYGQRVCMIGIQSTATEFGTIVHEQLVASRLFELETPVPPPAPPPATAGVPASAPATTPKAKTNRCARLRRQMGQLRRRARAARRDNKRQRAARLRKRLRQTTKRHRAKC